MSGRPDAFAVPWRRRPGGWERADGAFYVERGARMTDGGTAWMILERIPPEHVAREGAAVWDDRPGSLAATAYRIGADGYPAPAMAADDGPLYAHVGDAGSLTEAKAAAVAREARTGPR